MKTTIINLEGIPSVLSAGSIEQKLSKQPGIHKVEANVMTSTATVYHNGRVSLVEIKPGR